MVTVNRFLNGKKYSIMPQKAGFLHEHVMFNQSTSADFFRRYSPEQRFVLVEKILLFIENMNPDDLEARTRAQNEGMKVFLNPLHTFTQDFLQHEVVLLAIFHVLFPYNQIIRSDRQPCCSLYSDGYSVSYLLNKPELPVPTPHVLVPNPDFFNHDSGVMIVGVDPGMRSIGSYAGGDRRFSGELNEGEEPWEKAGNHFGKISSKEWKLKTLAIKRERYYHKVQQSEVMGGITYGRVVSEIPSGKFSSPLLMLPRIDYLNLWAVILFDFCARKHFLKDRFTDYRWRPKCLKWAAKKIAGDPLIYPKVIIAFGDWSKQDHLKGNSKAPLKGLKKALDKCKNVIEVFEVDEYLTSKACYQCGCNHVQSRMKNHVHRRRQKKGLGGWGLGFFGPEQLVKTYGVLRCPVCYTSWDRDINGALNIRMKGIKNKRGVEVPMHLKRPGN